MLCCVAPLDVAVCIVGSEKWGLLGNANVVTSEVATVVSTCWLLAMLLLLNKNEHEVKASESVNFMTWCQKWLS